MAFSKIFYLIIITNTLQIVLNIAILSLIYKIYKVIKDA